jgi:hypothetical protein
MSLTIYKGATIIYSTRARSLSTPRIVYHRDKLTNHVIRAKSIAEAEFVIRQDILIQGGKVEEESLFIDKIPIKMPIAINNNKNRHNKESELNNGVYIDRATAGEKTLKDA